MNNDIKEILDYFKNYVNDKYETYTVVSRHVQNLKILLYHITNLQKENEKVHKELYYADNCNIYLISKIDKANEFIKEHTNNFAEYLDVYEAKELLDILNGGDDND